MKKMDFLELYELDFNIKEIFALRQYWKENSCFKMNNPRKTSCFVWFCGCSANYKFVGGQLEVPCGSILYIPEGAVYESRFFNCENTLPSTILIEFSLYTSKGTHISAADAPIILKEESNAIIGESFNEAADLYLQSVISLSKIKSVVYNLISYFSRIERQKSIYSCSFNTI